MGEPLREPRHPRQAPLRPVRLGPLDVTLERRADGTTLVSPRGELPPFATRITDRLDHWAAVAPQRTFIARRERGGDWRRITYAEARDTARRIGAALLARGLSTEWPVAILSGNDLEHAMLALGALYVGIAHVPISPAYALISSDFGKLRSIIARTTPGLVFASDGAAFGKAIAAAVPADVEVVLAGGRLDGRTATPFEELISGVAGEAVDAAHAAVTPDTVAKLLFTSGSTGHPKGVINTERMICSNQVMLRESLAFMKDEPPVLLDWLPWNHTFGGNHNLGIALYNGGTLYIDDGRPMPAGIGETVRNLKEIAPTIYFNVPKGFESLVPHLEADRQLAESFFSRLNVNFFAGAGLTQHVWDALDAVAARTCGERILMLTGLGATETAPFALVCDPSTTRSGHVGLPATGNALKLAPVEGKLEARIKGPNVTPGYWRDPEATAKAFDEEGFYRLGDAVRFVDPADHRKGFAFDGRIAEDFKLSTGTWVSVGPLRAELLQRLAPLVRDVVPAGIDRGAVTALIFPDLEACRALAAELADAPPAAIVAHPAVRQAFADRLTEAARAATGSSNRVVRALLLAEPPSIDAGEMTDKGSINQRAVLASRAALVEELYAEPPSPRVIAVRTVAP